ncbi:hypothetical protein D3C72_1876580 [compost metagenome]
MLVDLQAGNAVGIEFHGPETVVLSDQDVRNHIFGFAGLDRLPRTGIERLDQTHRFFQHVFFESRNAHQTAEIMIRQQI